MKLSVVFSKTGDMKYIGHLDLMRLFQRSSRRAGIPVEVSKGFSPRMKISLKRALKLGVESSNEEALFCLSGYMAPKEFQQKIQAQLPEGVKILDAKIN